MLGGLLLLLPRHLHPQHHVGPRPRLLALQVVQQIQLVEPLDEGVLVPLVAEPHLLALLPELGLLQEAVDGLDGVPPVTGNGRPAAGRLQKGLAAGLVSGEESVKHVAVSPVYLASCCEATSIPHRRQVSPPPALVSPPSSLVSAVWKLSVQGDRLAQLHQVAAALAPD